MSSTEKSYAGSVDGSLPAVHKPNLASWRVQCATTKLQQRQHLISRFHLFKTPEALKHFCSLLSDHQSKCAPELPSSTRGCKRHRSCSSKQILCTFSNELSNENEVSLRAIAAENTLLQRISVRTRLVGKRCNIHVAHSRQRHKALRHDPRHFLLALDQHGSRITIRFDP